MGYSGRKKNQGRLLHSRFLKPLLKYHYQTKVIFLTLIISKLIPCAVNEKLSWIIRVENNSKYERKAFVTLAIIAAYVKKKQ